MSSKGAGAKKPVAKTPEKKQETNKVEPIKQVFTNVKNRTNQKQVVAFKGETFEFLAGETKKLPITETEAREKFSLFKNILIIN